MAEASMLLLTVMAAGIAAVSTGVVVMKSDSKRLPQSSGNTVSVLCLSSVEGADVFRKVVESELDDTASGPDRPGYRLVFRTVPADGEQRHRFASALEEARDSDHRSTIDGRPYVGAIVDAAGFKAFVTGVNDDYLPNFLVAMSPAFEDDPAKVVQGVKHWSCDGKIAEGFGALGRNDVEAALRKVRLTVVLQGMETPFPRLTTTLAGVDDRGAVVAKGVPGKGYLVFDAARVCPQKAGAPVELTMGLTAEQYKELRKERRMSEAEKPDEPLLPQYARDMAQVVATRGMFLCGRYLKDAADMCVSETLLSPHPERAREIAVDRGLENAVNWARS